MTIPEAAQLLALLSAFDGRDVDAIQARAYAVILAEVPYANAVDIAMDLMKHGERFVDGRSILAGYEAVKSRSRQQVRSAKLRGIVPLDWPESTPLTPDAKQRLFKVWAKENAETNDTAEDVLALRGDGPVTPVDLGLTLKAPEDEDPDE